MTNSNSRWHLAILVAVVALLLAVLNGRSEREGQPVALELEAGAGVATAGAELLTRGLPAPQKAKRLADGSESSTARTALARRGLIRGRLLLEGKPLEGQGVVLRRPLQFLDRAQGKQGSGRKPKTRRSRKRVNSWSDDFRRTDRTGEDGVFEFSNLDPGTYVVHVPSGEGFAAPVLGLRDPAFQLTKGFARRIDVEGVHDLGDIELLAEVPSSIELQSGSSGPALLEIESGQPGLIVRTYDQGAAGFDDGQRTDANGNASLSLRKATPIRIDLVDRSGYVLGSTNDYQSYPLNLETIVPIPAVPGTLAVQLPQDAEVQPGEKIQFTLLRNSSPAEHVIIKSLWGNSPVSKGRGVRTNREGIEFLALRAGTYSIKAMRRIVGVDGVLSSPTGGWMQGTAHVYPGQLTTCRLK